MTIGIHPQSPFRRYINVLDRILWGFPLGVLKYSRCMCRRYASLVPIWGVLIHSGYCPNSVKGAPAIFYLAVGLGLDTSYYTLRTRREPQNSLKLRRVLQTRLFDFNH